MIQAQILQWSIIIHLLEESHPIHNWQFYLIHLIVLGTHS